MLRLNLSTTGGLCCGAFIQNIVYLHFTVPAFEQFMQRKIVMSERFYLLIIYTSVFRVTEIHLLEINEQWLC